MKKVKTLFVQFDNTLQPHQVSSFRGAVIAKVGRENMLFHNHNGDTELVYKYPLIQYKSVHGKPLLFCLGDGVDEIHKLFGFKSWDLNLQGEKYTLAIDRLDLNSCNLQVWNKQFAYNITNWLALNSENYRQYKDLKSLADKIQMLERVLVGNILSFARGIDWTIEEQVEATIGGIKKEKMVKYKGVPLLAFDLEFSTNVYLPNYLGLGKSASHGFGMVRGKSEERND